MQEFNIYFSDLNEKAQEEWLKVNNCETAADGNWDMDIFPIATVHIEWAGEEEEE